MHFHSCHTSALHFALLRRSLETTPISHWPVWTCTIIHGQAAQDGPSARFLANVKRNHMGCMLWPVKRPTAIFFKGVVLHTAIPYYW